jgi:hypothetical protein
MPSRIALSTLNASTVQILNTIRANATQEYQDLVPKIEKEVDIPKVGDVLYGYPALGNQFVNALMNRIVLTVIRSLTFNNPFAKFKKGYLENGETVEEVFVNLVKAREFNVEKAEAREFKRSLPDVRAAFHIMNWRVQYPITIQDEDLRLAFLSRTGVNDMITKIINAVVASYEYDEYLLFKYLMIKAIAHGQMYPVAFDSTDLKSAAVQFRTYSNQLTFVNTKFNMSGVHTNTAKSEQQIFMDSAFNADYDVNVLASAFNMDKADFMGALNLIDSWNTFDSDRFDVILENCDTMEPITANELALMANVKAVLLDPEWFQVYDNLERMTQVYVASGMYQNYFYNVWKTLSTSPFSNAIVFVDNAVTVTAPTELTFTVASKSVSDEATVLTLELDNSTVGAGNLAYEFVQGETATTKGIAIHKFGGIIYPDGESTAITLEVYLPAYGVTLTAGTAIDPDAEVGDTFTFSAS